MKRILGVIALLSVMFLLVACGSEVVENNVEEVVEMEETSAPVVATGEVYQVAIENNQFMPIDLEVKVGEAVEWVNKDSEDHTVTFENGNFDVELVVGATGTYTFTEAGEYRYFCQFHPGMQGSVIVS
jgi:plastocyanin